MKKFLALALLLLALGLRPGLAGDFSGTVVGVSAGDALTVMQSGRPKKIRLYGSDCPEKGQPYFEEARKFSSEIALGKEVRVITRTVDEGGITHGDVILPDGKTLNRELVKAGLAWWHRTHASEVKELGSLEQKAKEAKRGLWQDAQPTAPWDYRQQKKTK